MKKIKSFEQFVNESKDINEAEKKWYIIHDEISDAIEAAITKAFNAQDKIKPNVNPKEFKTYMDTLNKLQDASSKFRHSLG
jgi:hypothetical protein